MYGRVCVSASGGGACERLVLRGGIRTSRRTCARWTPRRIGPEKKKPPSPWAASRNALTPQSSMPPCCAVLIAFCILRPLQPSTSMAGITCGSISSHESVAALVLALASHALTLMSVTWPSLKYA